LRVVKTISLRNIDLKPHAAHNAVTGLHLPNLQRVQPGAGNHSFLVTDSDVQACIGACARHPASRMSLWFHTLMHSLATDHRALLCHVDVSINHAQSNHDDVCVLVPWLRGAALLYKLVNANTAASVQQQLIEPMAAMEGTATDAVEDTTCIHYGTPVSRPPPSSQESKRSARPHECCCDSVCLHADAALMRHDANGHVMHAVQYVEPAPHPTHQIHQHNAVDIAGMELLTQENVRLLEPPQHSSRVRCGLYLCIRAYCILLFSQP
jgi:hypothetical protein